MKVEDGRRGSRVCKPIHESLEQRNPWWRLNCRKRDAAHIHDPFGLLRGQSLHHPFDGTRSLFVGESVDYGSSGEVWNPIPDINHLRVALESRRRTKLTTEGLVKSLLATHVLTGAGSSVKSLYVAGIQPQSVGTISDNSFVVGQVGVA